MSTELIAVSTCCTHYNVDANFFTTLETYRLIELQHEADEDYIPADRLRDVERYIHLHQDLDINMEGIEAIGHLLEKLRALQAEVAVLRQQSRLL